MLLGYTVHMSYTKHNIPFDDILNLSNLLTDVEDTHMYLRRFYHAFMERMDDPICQKEDLKRIGNVVDKIEEIPGTAHQKLELLSVCYGLDSFAQRHGHPLKDEWKKLYERMTDLYWKYIPACDDPAWTSRLLCEQLRFDPSTWHSMLLPRMREWYDEQSLRNVCNCLVEWAITADEQQRDTYLKTAFYLSAPKVGVPPEFPQYEPQYFEPEYDFMRPL